MKISERQGYAVLIVAAIIIAGQFGIIPNVFDYLQPGQVTPTLPGIPTPTVPGAPTREASAIQFGVHNAITDASISSANTFADVIKIGADGSISFMNKVEQVTVNSDPEQSGQTYSQGDQVIIHLSSDVNTLSGQDHYDKWFYATLKEGEPIRVLSKAILNEFVNADGYYYYKFKPGVVGAATGYTIQYTSGTTNYWGLGVLKLVPRLSSAQLDTYATLGTTTLSSVTDGSTWDATAGSSDKTMPTTNENVYISLESDTTNLGYASPMLTTSSKGELQTRSTVVIFSTTMTGIDASKLSDEGWVNMADSTLTAEKAYYRVIPEQVPVQGDRFTMDLKLPVDSSGASSSTTYTFKVWLLDFQLLDNVKIGSSSSSVPTTYGAIGEYGLDTIIHAKAYSVSGGAGTGQVLTFVLYTPA